jgi:hypothetical protein
MEIGDMVTVIMSNKNYFSFQVAPRITGCIIKHPPADVGDSWYFKVRDTEKEFSVNPNSSDFVGVELEKKAIEVENDDLPF